MATPSAARRSRISGQLPALLALLALPVAIAAIGLALARPTVPIASGTAAASIIVDPAEGLPPAKEFVLVQSDLSE